MTKDTSIILLKIWILCIINHSIFFFIHNMTLLFNEIYYFSKILQCIIKWYTFDECHEILASWLNTSTGTKQTLQLVFTYVLNGKWVCYMRIQQNEYPNIIALPLNHLSFLSCYAMVVLFFRKIIYGANKRHSMLEGNKGISICN